MKIAAPKTCRGSLSDIVMDETSYPDDQGYSDHSIASKSAEDADDDLTQDNLANIHDQNITLLENRKEGRVYCNRALSSGLLCNEECASAGGLKHHLAQHVTLATVSTSKWISLPQYTTPN